MSAAGLSEVRLRRMHDIMAGYVERVEPDPKKWETEVAIRVVP